MYVMAPRIGVIGFISLRLHVPRRLGTIQTSFLGVKLRKVVGIETRLLDHIPVAALVFFA